MAEVHTESVVKTESDVIKHCKHFVSRKKRYCRMTVKEGEDYCGEHQIEGNRTNETGKIGESKKRIVCPLDNKQLSNLHMSVFRPKTLICISLRKFIDTFAYSITLF